MSGHEKLLFPPARVVVVFGRDLEDPELVTASVTLVGGHDAGVPAADQWRQWHRRERWQDEVSVGGEIDHDLMVRVAARRWWRDEPNAEDLQWLGDQVRMAWFDEGPGRPLLRVAMWIGNWSGLAFSTSGDQVKMGPEVRGDYRGPAAMFLYPAILHSWWIQNPGVVLPARLGVRWLNDRYDDHVAFVETVHSSVMPVLEVEPSSPAAG